MPMNEVEELRDCFVSQISPLRIYLFGSFAEGTNHEQSDFDFYLVVKDGTKDLAAVTSRAYRAIRQVKRRPVDILVGTESRFNERMIMPTVEKEVFQKGVLLYG